MTWTVKYAKYVAHPQTIHAQMALCVAPATSMPWPLEAS